LLIAAITSSGSSGEKIERFVKMAIKSMVDLYLLSIVASLLLVSLSLQDSPTCYYPDSSTASDFNYTTCNLGMFNWHRVEELRI
jgi:hypothetical protein